MKLSRLIAARYLCCYIPLTDPFSIFRKILVGPSWARGLFEVVLVCGPLLPHWGMFLLHEMDFYLTSLTSEMYYFRSMSHPNGFQVWAQKIRGSVWVLWVLLCGWKLCWDWNSTWFVIPHFERFEEGSQSTPQSFCSKLIRTTDTPFCSNNYSELFQQ